MILSLFNIVLAATTTYQWDVPLPPAPSGYLPAELNFVTLVTYLYYWGLGIGGLLAFIRLIISGIQWGTSAGNVNSVKNARDAITSTIFGLVLLLGAWLLLNTINPQIVNPGEKITEALQEPKYEAENIETELVSLNTYEVKIPPRQNVSWNYFTGIGGIPGGGPINIPTNYTCGNGGLMPNLPTSSGCNLKIGALNGAVGNELRTIISSAAHTFKVPPSLILAVMYGEGAFNGQFPWNNDSIVRQASGANGCMPGCDPATPFTWILKGIPVDDEVVKRIFPNRNPNPCNPIDVVFTTAHSIDYWEGYTGEFGMPECFGLDLNIDEGEATSCFWTDNQVAKGIKGWESGISPMCLTLKNSCLLGGGTKAACPGGDNCETINNRYIDQPSHFGCLWDVYNNNK
ncbi:MAG TPA: hypothetical protein PLA57_00020 [Candidatus Paceibacterota bacterium]|jgi:hypothetical protein|nr:hypothetical protein [Candidatus Paceibacterota bacterium]HRS47858.1 hypothetical protein [Candidatus Paceibacterota bacterium]